MRRPIARHCEVILCVYLRACVQAVFSDGAVFSPTWTCSPRTAESPSSGSAGGVLMVTDFSERLSLLRDLWRSRLRSLLNRGGKKAMIS